MRRIALLIALVAVLAGSTGCCWNWSDPVHPRVCPVVHACDGCLPCDQRSDYSRRGNYP